MTLDGWIIMLGSVGGIFLFFIWCLVRVLRDPAPKEHLHAPLDSDIDTKDRG